MESVGRCLALRVIFRLAEIQYGYTAFDMPIKYYAFLDIDNNDVNELIAADNAGTPETWTGCEI